MERGAFGRRRTEVRRPARRETRGDSSRGKLSTMHLIISYFIRKGRFTRICSERARLWRSRQIIGVMRAYHLCAGAALLLGADALTIGSAFHAGVRVVSPTMKVEPMPRAAGEGDPFNEKGDGSMRLPEDGKRTDLGMYSRDLETGYIEADDEPWCVLYSEP